jgi:hypothetical protein
MRRLLVVALLSSVALAGETYLGTTEVCAPAHCSNFYSDGGGFVVPTSQRLTAWCNASAFVSVGEKCVATIHSDGGVVDGGAGLPVAASTLFPTSTGTGRCYLSLDGGVFGGNGGSIVKTAGASSGVCHWYLRLGTE